MTVTTGANLRCGTWGRFVAMVTLIGCSITLSACRTPRPDPYGPVHPEPPDLLRHSAWATSPPLGVSADAARRNKKAGDSLTFHDLTITVMSTRVDSTSRTPVDRARLQLALGAAREEREVREGEAFNWRGHHIAIVAIYGPGELGAGLVAMEVGTVASLPPEVANSDSAGGANMRLRIPHRITHVTLHHTGDARPLTRAEDPTQRLRNLQSWGARDRNWWDLPYHILLDLDGRYLEGRDWRYMGETNTTYDPGGHFLISMIGNYEQQEPSQQQLEQIADLMTWALKTFKLPASVIGGHYMYAETGCPGKHLRKYLEDGTLQRMVAARLH